LETKILFHPSFQKKHTKRFMKKILILLFACTIPFISNAQYGEIGVFGGMSLYQGDLTPGAVSIQSPNVAYGFFVGYSPVDRFTLKGSFYMGRIAADDADQKSVNLQERNLSFRSNIAELALRAEFNLWGYQPANMYTPFSPYIFAGVAATHHNPKAEYQGTWYELQPLGTEGQGIQGYTPKYDRVVLALPVGGGVKYALSERFTLGFELGVRKTFTDYLDDVSTVYVDPDVLLNSSSRGELIVALSNRTGEFLNSEPTQFEDGAQRGNPNNDDAYLIAGFSISYNIIGEGSYYGRKKKRAGCKY